MALSDQIAKNKKILTRGPGGVLTEETPEEIQSLASKAGLPAPPVTATGAGALGANPDQQKMIGTPAQKQAALTIAQQPLQDLASAQRLQEIRTQRTTEEQQAAQKAEQLKQLGSTGARVQDLVNAQVSKLAQSTVVPSSVQISPDVAPEAKTHLQTLKANPKDQNALANLNRVLGRPANNPIKPEELNQMYESTLDTLSRAGAEVVDNNITAGDLINLPEFGYNKAQLSELLGVPEDQVDSLSLGQLRSLVDTLVEGEYQRTSNLESQAASGLTGAAERSMFRQQAREASATGTRSTEADMQHLDQQIENADQVQFGGKTMGVEDVLKDETISGLIKDYLEAPEGSPERAQLEQSEPGLIQFINNNRNLLAEAASQLGQTATDFATKQKANLAIGNIGGQQLSPEFIKNLIPGFGEATDVQYDANNYPLLKYAKGLTGANAGNFVNKINALYQQYPDLGQELSKLSAQEIKGLGIEANSPKLQKYLEARRQFDILKDIDPTDSDSVLSALFGQNVSSSAIDAEIKANKLRKSLGLPSNPELDKIDANNDGKLDSSTSIYNAAKAAIGQPSLKAAASGNIGTPIKVGDISLNPLTSDQKLLYNKTSEVLADGVLTPAEAKTLSSNLSDSDVFKLADLDLPKGPLSELIANRVQSAKDTGTSKLLTNPAVNAIRSFAATNFKSIMGDGIDPVEARGTIVDQINKLQQAVAGPNSKYLNVDVVKTDIKNLQSIQKKIEAEIKRRDDEAAKAAALAAKKVSAISQARTQSRLDEMKKKSQSPGIVGSVVNPVVDFVKGFFD